MISSEVSLIIIIILLFGWMISLWRQNKTLQNENQRLKREAGEYEVMKKDAKGILKTTEEVKTIK